MVFKQTIAIVNDERNILISLRLTLENLGYDVRTHSDPLVALDELTARPPHLAILNGRMPRMHGIELFRRLREHSNLPVIFLSASAEEIGETLRAPNMAADDYIQIPFSQRHLLERVALRLSIPSA